MKASLFIAITLLFFLASCSSKKQKFKIDSSVSSAIDSTFKENILFDSPVKPEFSFHVANTFDYQRFGQNGMDLAYFLKTDSYNLADVYVSSITACNLNKDTIVLVGGLFYESGIAFRITIFGDQCNTQTLLTSADRIYAKTNQKEQLQKEIMLNPDSLSITLTQKPVFKIGSTVKGKIKLIAEPFYQLDKDNVLFRITPAFDIIFDTRITEKEKD